jgi:CRISPR/Cas system-associated protein Csx1
MADEPSIQRFTNIINVGKMVELNRKTKTGRTVYRWQTQTEDTVKLALRNLWPHLGIQKRLQAIEALASRQIYLNERETHCKRQHDLSVTKKFRSSGQGYCGECMKIWRQVAKEKRTSCAL